MCVELVLVFWQFDLSCKDSADKKLSFVLREDIIVADSTCKSMRGEEVCTLAKKHEHFWDRLPFDQSALPGLTQDWSKWMNEAEDESPTDAFYSSPPESKVVKTVNAELYAKTLKESAAVFIDASLPWCTKCAFTRKGFTAAAKQLGGDQTPFGKTKPISFVYINTMDDRLSARRLNVTCDFPCQVFPCHIPPLFLCMTASLHAVSTSCTTLLAVFVCVFL